MKKIFTVIVLFTCIYVHAQNFDHLMVRQLDCRDVSLNSSMLFEKYITQNEIDSARMILNYWEEKCGNREPIMRAKLLLAIYEKNYSESLFPENIIYNIFNYQSRTTNIKYHDYDYYMQYLSYIPTGQKFDKFTYNMFASMKQEYIDGQPEFLWCEFYSDNCDTIFYRLQSGKYDDTKLCKEYNKLINSYLKIPEINFAFIAGVWIPTGKLQTLGIHPELGFQGGWKYKKMHYDLTGAVRFINSANEYYTRRTKNDELEPTRHFLGGYIGIDVGRDIYAKHNHELQLIGGIGLDFLETIKENKDLNLKAVSTNSYNFNLGFGYRYYIKNDNYLGLKVKYNLVNYTLGKIVDLTGNAITCHIIFGGLGHYYRNDNLKTLKYRYRK